MKKIRLILFLALLALCGCQNETTSDPLCGSWKLTAAYSASYDGEPFANGKFTPWKGEETFFIFSENGDCSLQGYFGDRNCQYRYENSMLELYVPKGLVAQFDVISLSNKEMVLCMESSYYYKFKK